jgi:hypothetical protein
MKNPPTGPNEHKMEGNYKYHWCPHRKIWQQHDPEDCRLNPSNRGRAKMPSKPQPLGEQRGDRDEKRHAWGFQHDHSHNQQKRPFKKNKYNNKKKVAFQAANDDESYYSDSHDYDEEEETSLVPDYNYGDYKKEE